jgi:hypothetical protein
MMKAALMLLASVAVVGSGSARGAGTQAVSREAVLYVMPAPATLAVSREAVLYVAPRAAAVAVSREATMYVASVSTQTASREATLFVNYRLPDVLRALRLAAGFGAASPTDKTILNVVTTGGSATVLDVLDAAAVARMVAHPELLP